MNKFVKTCILVFIVFVGGFVLYHRNEIQTVGDVFSIAQTKLAAMIPASDTGRAFTSPSQQAEEARPLDRLRIATFKLNPYLNIQLFPNSRRLMADICRQFDLIAFQQLAPQDSSSMSELLVMLNQKGGDYRPFSSRNGSGFAIIYDANSVELDQSHYYTVNDPDNLFTNKPLVGWFRSKRALPERAFTFSIANVQAGNDRGTEEINQLGNLFRAIRDDGRGEDDILIVGDFNASDHGLSPIHQSSGLVQVVSGQPTDTLQTVQLDNIILNPQATIEFSGRAGVFDFVKKFNLRLEDATSISDRLPVWAEFSIYEGHQLSPVAPGRGKRNRLQQPAMPTYRPGNQFKQTPGTSQGRVAGTLPSASDRVPASQASQPSSGVTDANVDQWQRDWAKEWNRNPNEKRDPVAGKPDRDREPARIAIPASTGTIRNKTPLRIPD